MADSQFYKTFSEKSLTTYGAGRRSRIERHRLSLLERFAKAPGAFFEIGPGHGTLGELAETPEEARAALSGLAELERLGLVRRGFAGRWERAA